MSHRGVRAANNNCLCVIFDYSIGYRVIRNYSNGVAGIDNQSRDISDIDGRGNNREWNVCYGRRDLWRTLVGQVSAKSCPITNIRDYKTGKLTSIQTRKPPSAWINRERNENTYGCCPGTNSIFCGVKGRRCRECQGGPLHDGFWKVAGNSYRIWRQNDKFLRRGVLSCVSVLIEEKANRLGMQGVYNKRHRTRLLTYRDRIDYSGRDVFRYTDQRSVFEGWNQSSWWPARNGSQRARKRSCYVDRIWYARGRN